MELLALSVVTILTSCLPQKSFTLLQFREVLQPSSKFCCINTSRTSSLCCCVRQDISCYFRRNELVNVDEQKQKEALQEFYENETLKRNNQNRIKSLKTFSRVTNPLFCVGFVIVFWAVGMQHYFQKF